MRRFVLLAVLALPLLAAPAAAQYGIDADRLVRDWYHRFLGRDPDPLAVAWTDPLKKGQAPAQVLSQILATPDYYGRGGGTDEGFLRQLYMDLTGRPPTREEMAYWMPRVRHAERQEVAYALLTRYPQSWEAPSPPPPTARPEERPEYRDEDRYEYRRPSRSWERPAYRRWYD